MSKKNKKGKEPAGIRWKTVWSSAVGLTGIIVLMLYYMGVLKGVVREHYLKSRAVFIKAVVIDKKNYNPNQSIPDGFSYSYRFYIDGVPYEGNALDNTLHVGDSVEVEYVRGHPSMNRAVVTKDW